MALSPSLGNAGRQSSHFVSGGGQKVAVVSRHTRACPLVPPTMSSRRRLLSAPLRYVSPKRRQETSPLSTVSRFSSSIPLRDELPTSSPRLPHLRGLDHLPFCARRTLWTPSSRQKLSHPLVLAIPSRSPCLRHGHYHRRLLLRLSSTSNGDEIPPVPPSRDIITPFYSRFIGLYQLHCHRTVCIVVAWPA